MPDAPDAAASPVADASAVATQPAVPESTDAPQSGRPFSFARAVGAAPETPPALNGAAPAPKTDDDDATDEESSEESESNPTDKPSDGVKPAADQPKPSRRERAREANEARIAELEAAVAAEQAAKDAAVEAARAEERARIERERTEAQQSEAQQELSRKHLQDVQRLQRLRALPDGELSAEDYAWREEQNALLLKYPEVEKHYETVAEQRIAAERAVFERASTDMQAAFWSGLHEQLAKAATLPNVKAEDLRPDAQTPLDTWDKMAGYYHAAGAAWKDAEYAPQLAQRDERISQLEDEVRDLKLVGPRGLGSARAPVTGGRSAGVESGPPVFDPTKGARRSLAHALTGSAG